MASKKKESEGISLLSMYGDDEDDDDMEEEEDLDDGHDEMAVSPKEEVIKLHSSYFCLYI